MKIHKLFDQKKPVISFEIFPPKPDYPIETIFSTIEELKDAKPDFISVTYGAAGSAKNRTAEIVSKLKNEYRIESLPHLTCASHTREHIDEVLDYLREENIHNVLALRGDPPVDKQDFDFEANEYKSSIDLIQHIKEKNYDFSVGAAAYPEGHSECTRRKADLEFIKRKVDSGADFLITQLFFDNRIFYDFEDSARSIGIHCPISVGIMPIFNAKQIKRITYLCGASIPSRLLTDVIEKYADNPQDLEQAGIEYATRQIDDLIHSGADGIHIYSMNKPKQIKQILENLNLYKSASSMARIR